MLRTTESILWALFFHKLDDLASEEDKIAAINTCFNQIDPKFRQRDFQNIVDLKDFYNGEQEMFSVPIYFWELETYKEAFKRANLVNFQFHDTIISEEAIRTHGEEFWEPFRKETTTAVFTAEKP